MSDDTTLVVRSREWEGKGRRQLYYTLQRLIVDRGHYLPRSALHIRGVIVVLVHY